MPEFSTQLLAYGFVWYVAFLFSTTCHEAAHALVAKLGGDETAASGGQVSLNPVPHIQREPWGMVVIPILSFIFTRGMIGRASGELHADAIGHDWLTSGPEHGLAAKKSGNRAAEPADRGPVRVLLVELTARHLQFASSATTRWQRGNHAVHERKPGAALPGLAARQQLCHGGPTGRPACFPLLLRSRGEFRYQP